MMPRYNQITGRDKRTIGEKIADAVTGFYGSWKFIIIQTVIIVFWITFNTMVKLLRFDPPPFIGLNLLLSLEAAYSAAFILMSQNRLSDMDRKIFGHTDKEVTKIIHKIDKLEKGNKDE